MTVASMRRRGLASIALVALLVPSASWAAARVEFSIGPVTATDAAGQERPLSRGAELIAGDTVFTHSGRTQLRFTDGAFVSLQPNSEFRIDEYRFDGKVDGSERGVFSLIKGGLRTITGLIGRSNRNNYRVSTSVATIGIRGTEYTMAYAERLSGTVGQGEIAVCNVAGCLNVANGESYLVAKADVLPVMSDKKTDLEPPQPADPPGGVFQTANDPTEQSNNQAAAGNSLTCSPPGSTHCGPSALTQTSLTQEQRASVSPGLRVAAIVLPGTNALPAQDVALLTDGNGQAVAVGSYAIGSAVVKQSRGDNIASIWTWGGGFATGPAGPIDLTGPAGLHFAVGTPASATELSALRASNTTLSFTTIEAKTTPTLSAGNATLDLRATTLTIDFLTLATQVSLTLAVDGAVTTIGGMQGTIDVTTARFSAGTVGTPTGPSAHAEGLVVGQQPNLKGTYVYSATNVVPNATIAGAVIVRP